MHPMPEPDVNEFIMRHIVVGVFAENCWVIGSRRTGEGIVIDPGDQPEDILALAKDMGVNVKVIANTHAHIDHILGVRGVQEKTDAKFLLHEQDLEIARGAARGAAQMLGKEVQPPPDPDAFLSDGDVVEVDGLKLQVIHTPGHTQGSIAFYTEGMLFSGDTLFRGSVGRTDLPGGNQQQEIASIVDKLLTLPDDTVVLPGHMEETRIEHERKTNPFVLEELSRRREA